MYLSCAIFFTFEGRLRWNTQCREGKKSGVAHLVRPGERRRWWGPNESSARAQHLVATPSTTRARPRIYVYSRDLDVYSLLSNLETGLLTVVVHSAHRILPHGSPRATRLPLHSTLRHLVPHLTDVDHAMNDSAPLAPRHAHHRYSADFMPNPEHPPRLPADEYAAAPMPVAGAPRPFVGMSRDASGFGQMGLPRSPPKNKSEHM